MAWIDEQRQTLAQAQRARSVLPTVLTWLFMACCFGLVLAVAFVVFKPMLIQEAIIDQNRRLPGKDEQTTLSDVYKAHESEARKTQRVARSGVRIGTRSLAPLLAQCRSQIAFVDEFAAARLKKAPVLPSTPEEYEARFMFLENLLFKAKAVKWEADLTSKRQNDDKIKYSDVFSALTVSAFVNCSLSQPSSALCQPDNRAAALTFIDSYWSNYQKALPIMREMQIKDRLELDRLMPPYRHDNIAQEIEKHARAGVIRASDLGLFASTGLKNMFEKYRDVPDGCAN